MTHKASTRTDVAKPRIPNGHANALQPRALMRAPAGLTRAVTQWSVGIKPSWTAESVQSALRSHAEGNFAESAQLWDAMGEDDAIPGLMDKRVNRLLGEDFELRPVDEKGRRRSASLAKRFEGSWWDMFPESELSDLLRWKHGLGVAVGVLDWETGASEWTARLRTLHPQWLRHDQWRRKWIYSAREGELEVTPGDGRWILLTDGQRGWMRGFVRSLAIDWIAKQLTIRDQNRYNERHGLPIIKAIAPAFADDADREAFFEDVQSMGNETVALLPTHLEKDSDAKFDIQLLEATDRSYGTFGSTIDRIDRKFTIRIVGANLGTEVNDTGAYAASESHNEVLRELAHADAQKLSTELRAQALLHVCAVNVPDVDLSIVPWPKWATEAIGDAGEIAQGQATFGNALQAVQSALGSKREIANVAELAERHGMQVVDVLPDAERTTPLDQSAVGAQFDAVMRLVERLNAKQMPRESAVSILVKLFGLSEADADKMLGDVGKGFTPAPPAPTFPFAPKPDPESEPDDEPDTE